MAEPDVADRMERADGHVLVVDDVRANRFVLERMLSQMGCSVTSAEDGPSALQLAKEAPPDLALVDVMMPGMDGYEVCRRLKSHNRTKDVPVIMVTALSEIEDLETAFDAGAMDYVCRPFNPRELIVRVRNALQLKHQGDCLRRFQDRMSHELDLAGALQTTMLSIPPLLNSKIQVATAYRPSFKVSGDFYDRITLPNGLVCLYVVDVMGHGVAAAMLSSLLKAIFTDVVRSAGGMKPLHDLCNEVDGRFRRSIKSTSTYATAFLGVYDPGDRSLLGMNCGHPSPILVAPDGGALRPFEKRGSVPIGCGWLGDEPYTDGDEVRLVIEPGSVLFAYTDGLIEAQMSGDGEECGIAHLEETLCRVVGKGDVLGGCSTVMEELHREGYFLSADDCTAVMLRAVPAEEVLFTEDIPADFEKIRITSTAVEKLLLKRDWSETRAAAFQLMFAEYCNNTVLHGGCNERDMLAVHMCCSNACCTLSIRDPGPEWRYPTLESGIEMPDESLECGRGLAIMCRVADNLKIYREEGQNVAIFTVLRYSDS